MTYTHADGSALLEGVVIEARRPHRLVHTFRAQWQPDFATDKPTRVTWEITEQGDRYCRLSDLDVAPVAARRTA